MRHHALKDLSCHFGMAYPLKPCEKSLRRSYVHARAPQVLLSHIRHCGPAPRCRAASNAVLPG